MDHEQTLDASRCGDLKRLASVAATVGYSTNGITVAGHHIEGMSVESYISTGAILESYTPETFDMSRAPCTTFRIAEYQPKVLYDPSRVVTNVSGQSGHFLATAQPHTSRSAHFNTFIHRGSELPTFSVATTNVEIDSRSIAIIPAVGSHTLFVEAPNSDPSFMSTNVQLQPADENDSSAPVKKKKRNLQKKKNIQEKKDDSEGKIATLPIPDPVIVQGKKQWLCDICSKPFNKKYCFRRHQLSHLGERRGSLSLEKKVEIIKRIKDGEKQVNLAIEHNVGRSTLSFLMKNADKIIEIWKSGKFNPDRKRLRGAQRGDVEEALYEWYKLMMEQGQPMSGTILKQKARIFAAKLGYKEFKATNGWLDRFKQRKKIVLPKNKNKSKETLEELEEGKGDFASVVLPNILQEYDSDNVFFADEIGLFYRMLPGESSSYKDVNCAGGLLNKQRVTVLMCTNMTGSEKFPLVVVGKQCKPKCFKNIKCLPVQYLSDSKAWMTTDIFSSWLRDLDSWFVQQNRKVLLLAPSIPVHPKNTKLNAVRFLLCPINFVSPYRFGIMHSLKRIYRRSILERLLNNLETQQQVKRCMRLNMKLTLLDCLHMFAGAWHAVTGVIINNSFQRAGISKYGMWGMNLVSVSNFGNENLNLIHRLRLHGLKIDDNFDEYIIFDDNIKVCNMMDVDDILAIVAANGFSSSDSEEEDCTDNSLATGLPSSSVPDSQTEGDSCGPTFTDVKKSLSVLRRHAHSRDIQEEMLRILSHLEAIMEKSEKGVSVMEQATVSVECS